MFSSWAYKGLPGYPMAVAKIRYLPRYIAPLRNEKSGCDLCPFHEQFQLFPRVPADLK